MTGHPAPALFKWGSPVERERQRRIMLAVYAYAYELQAAPLVSDAEFDALSLRIRPDMRTGNPALDAWWRTEWSPHTGQWIHAHPDLPGVAAWYERLKYAQRT
jgi:hypothetical protein